MKKVYIKFLDCDSEVCVKINKRFSSSQKEDITQRTLFYQTHLPRMIIHEFYNRHIFEQDLVVPNDQYPWSHYLKNGVYKVARLNCGCEKFKSNILKQK